jgi:hypothetical protein
VREFKTIYDTFRSRWLSVLVGVALVAVAVIAMVIGLSGPENGDSSLQTQYRRLRLTTPHGDFRIWLTSYPEGADVTIDNIPEGHTPLALASMEPGQHFVQLRMSGYLPIDSAVVIGESDGAVFEPLVFRRGLYFESTPDAAMIIVNGDTLPCITPCSAEFPVSDTLNISLKHSALDAIWMSYENLASGEWHSGIGQMWEVELDSSLARLRISGWFFKPVRIVTAPTGAAVVFAENDSTAGESGNVLQLPMGRRDYVLRKQGFDDLPISLSLNLASPDDFSFELTRSIAITAFDLMGDATTDIGARIVKMDRGSREFYADANTPTSIRIPATEHRVFFEADGYAETSVVISADQTSLAVGMRPIFDRKTESREEQKTAVTERVLVRFVVTDKQTHERLSDVEIIADIKEQDRKVILGRTDLNGEYEQLLPPGKYEFVFDKDGYKPDDKGAKLKSGEPKTLEIKLKRR